MSSLHKNIFYKITMILALIKGINAGYYGKIQRQKLLKHYKTKKPGTDVPGFLLINLLYLLN